jgi:hypothetical protein
LKLAGTAIKVLKKANPKPKARPKPKGKSKRR